MTDVTTFYALFQGDHADREGDATCLAIFSTEKKAYEMLKHLSDKHTELKREENEALLQAMRASVILEPQVPNLYWDVRPVPFDPRGEEEL